MSSEVERAPRLGTKWYMCDRCERRWPLHDTVKRDGFKYCRRSSCFDDLNPIDFVDRSP
jgi:hypothetical protein